MGKRVLILTAIEDEITFVADIAKSYKRGVVQGGGPVDEINIAKLNFANLIDVTKITLKTLEPDLVRVRNLILQCDHLVFITEVHKQKINLKLSSFFDRLFALQGGLPMKNLWQPSDFAGKTARIISILDDEAWKEYNKKGRYIAYNPIKKQALQLFGINVVRTTSLGDVIKGVFNEYYHKWINKMILLGKNQY
jgi:multimeric flavodoxin WrbA